MLHKSGIKLLLAILLLGFSTVGAKAANYTVTTTFDNGAGSLRAAVATAGGQTANDTINFNIPASDSNCSNGVCTIILTSGEIPINANSATGNVTITNQGGAHKIIISGNGNFRVFNVTLGDAAATIDGVTIANGNPTGANNYGGAITVKSLATSSQPLAITNSTIRDNTAQLGGGIFTDNAKVTITNSTLNNNSAFGLGGAIEAYNENASVTIINSTLSGNQAGSGGGIANIGSTVTIINSTISTNKAPAGNCGGINNFDSSQTKTYTRNTIISANTAIGQPDICHGSSDAFVSRGNNLIGNTNDTNRPIAWQQTDLLNRQPRVSALGDNGGPTQTHALQSDSEAINKGNTCVLTANGCGDGNPALAFDQRGSGYSRSAGSSVDIGAFELQQNIVTRATQFDFDGDGKADVSVTRNNGGNLTWYLLNSTIGFGASQFGLATDKLVPADYDGDGKTDIAVFRDGTWFWLNSSTNTFNAAQFGQAGDIPVPADYSGDKRAELAVYRNGVWYTLNLVNNQFQAAQFGLATDKPVPADYDGDGKTDFAVFRNGTWFVLGSTQGFNAAQFGLSNDIPVPADYDGDGKADFAVARSSGNNLTWYLNRSQAGFTGVQFGLSTDQAVENAYIP